jgi:hypothetical protein
MDCSSFISSWGILLVILLVYAMIICITSSVTGSIWLSKIINQPLKDSYNIVLYDYGSNPIAVRRYILDGPHSLTPDQVDSALIHQPAIIFSNVHPSDANKIVEDLRQLGAYVDAV